VRVQRHAYGQTALAARLLCEQGHAHTAWQWFRSPDVLALLPFDRPERDHSHALVWSLPSAQAAELRQLGDEAFEARLNDAVGKAVGASVGPLRLASERAAGPLSLARAEPLCGRGWVLIGDAAHVVHPLAGQGLNLGLADVVSLAQVIAEREPWRPLGDELMLRRHARARSMPTQAMAGLTDGLLSLFANDLPLVRELRNRGMGWINQLAPVKRLLTARALDA
jgi:ubiquinone biosynthesis UbiH/UbiF/VisC/COQ6 family hydroxylase